MSLQQTLINNWTSPQRTPLLSSVTESGSQEDNRSEAVANNVSQDLNLNFLLAGLQLFYLLSDQNLTLQVNALGTHPEDQFVITAGIAFGWCIGSGLPIPFLHDVGDMRVVNHSGAVANVEVRTLHS